MARHSIATGQLVCGGAADGGGNPISDSDSADIEDLRWMREAGMIEDGVVVDSLVSVRTVLSQPVPRGECDSRISIKLHLQQEGWIVAATAGEASLRQSRFNPAAPFEYFWLFKHCSEFLAQYDEQYVFRHNQSKGYYETLSALHTAVTDPLLP